MAHSIRVTENLIEVLLRGVSGVEEHKQGAVMYHAAGSNREPLPLLGLKSDGRDNFNDPKQL